MEVHEERKKRIRNRIDYWKDVKAQMPESKTAELADKMIRSLENVLIEMDAQMAREAAANEKKR